MILSIAEEIARVEMSYRLETSVEDYQKEFKFGLVEVVYEWAKGQVKVLGMRLVYISVWE